MSNTNTDTRPSSVLAPQTRELLVLMIDPVASVAHLDARARERAALIPVRRYVALAKDYHDEPTDSRHPTVNHKILLLSNTIDSAVGLRLEEPLNLPWPHPHLEPSSIDVRVRIAERDYTPARCVSSQELARVNKACRALEAFVMRSASSPSRSDSYDSLDFEAHSISTMPTSQGAVENASLSDERYCEAGPSQPNPKDSFLHMLSDDEDEDEDWLSLSDHPDYTDCDPEPSLIGSSASSSRSPSPSGPRDLYGAPIDPALGPFCTLEYEAHLRRTRAPVVDVWYDLSLVDVLEDPKQFHDECAALDHIIRDAERRLGRTASFSFDSASSRETLEEQSQAMLHPENMEWEGWPLAPRDTDSAIHSETDMGTRGRESFLIMTAEKELTFRRRKLMVELQRLQTEIGWRCASALRMVIEGPSRREMRVLQQDLWGPFD